MSVTVSYFSPSSPARRARNSGYRMEYRHSVKYVRRTYRQLRCGMGPNEARQIVVEMIHAGQSAAYVPSEAKP